MSEPKTADDASSIYDQATLDGYNAGLEAAACYMESRRVTASEFYGREIRDLAPTYRRGPFRRHSDPRGCPERSGHSCLGVQMHCRLAPHGEDVAHAMEVSVPYVLSVLECAGKPRG